MVMNSAKGADSDSDVRNNRKLTSLWKGTRGQFMIEDLDVGAEHRKRDNIEHPKLKNIVFVLEVYVMAHLSLSRTCSSLDFESLKTRSRTSASTDTEHSTGLTGSDEIVSFLLLVFFPST